MFRSSFWTACYQAHFQHHFNKPFDIQVYHDQENFALKVAIYDWAARNYKVYASMGLADKLVENGESDFGEVILFSDVPDKEVPEFFVQALFFILHNDIPLGSRFAIGGMAHMRSRHWWDQFVVWLKASLMRSGAVQARSAFTQRYEKSALYFTSSLNREEDDPFAEVHNGDEVGRVYQAYFISPQEHQYLEEVGPDEFEKALRDQPGDTLSIRRHSFV